MHNYMYYFSEKSNMQIKLNVFAIWANISTRPRIAGFNMFWHSLSVPSNSSTVWSWFGWLLRIYSSVESRLQELLRVRNKAESPFTLVCLSCVSPINCRRSSPVSLLRSSNSLATISAISLPLKMSHRPLRQRVQHCPIRSASEKEVERCGRNSTQLDIKVQKPPSIITLLSNAFPPFHLPSEAFDVI